jgi:hypothetical protein
MAQQMSYRDVFVTNTSTLLADGATVESLAVGQIGILDSKTYTAKTAPTYATVKAFEIVQGTPDLAHLPFFSGVPNQNDYSKLIKGKLLKDFRGFKAKRGQDEIVTVGWSGDLADTDTLFANPGQEKRLYLTLTGGPITKKFSKQGVTRIYTSKVGTVDDLTIDRREIANQLVKAINADSAINDFVTVGSLVTCSPALDAASTDTDYKFTLTVCDTRDDVALGLVQAQYPDDIVKRVSVTGAFSVYEVTRDTNTTPDAFSNSQIALIPECDECPTGYSLVDNEFAYRIKRADAGSAGNLTTLASDYGITGDETASRVNYEYGTSTYIVTSATALTVSGVDSLEFLGSARATCVLDTPTEIDWVAGDTLVKYSKSYRITLADTVCGTSRLADLQAAYPSLTVALVDESSGDCVHTFETSVFSNLVELGCSVEEIKFVKPAGFEGAQWVAVADEALPDGTVCKVGIQIEAKYTEYIPSEVTYDSYVYEQDAVHITVSEFQPDWNGLPSSFESRWAIKKIQAYQKPQGHGAIIRSWEKQAKGYRLRERSFDPRVREIEGYQFQADSGKFYDEYILTFDFDYKVGGWSQSYSDSYKLHVFFPEGQGKNFEAAINSYVSSVGLEHIAPVVL